MDCQGCGRSYSERLPRCPSCKLRPGKPIIEEPRARLIEFPRRNAGSGVAETATVALPAWRQELSERVRARRSEQAAAAALAPVEEPLLDLDTASPMTLPGDTEIRRPANSPANPTGNPIVEAALNRVRRANKVALRAALPKIEPAPTAFPVNTTPDQFAGGVRDATVWESTDGASIAEPSQPGDPVDLQADSQVHSTAEEGRDTPTGGSVLIGAVVDLVVPAIGTLPLALIASFTGVNGSGLLPVAGFASMFLVIALYYLTLTHLLLGRTFGMMLIGSRLISLRGDEKISTAQALVRSVAFLVSAALAFIGVLWLIVNPLRRGWYDYLAGTRIVLSDEF